MLYYALVGRALEAYCSRHVYVCVHVIVSFVFLHNCLKLGTENHNAGIMRYFLESLLIIDLIFDLKRCSLDTV